MNATNRQQSRCAGFLVGPALLAVLFFTGCGVAEYERRLEESVSAQYQANPRLGPVQEPETTLTPEEEAAKEAEEQRKMEELRDSVLNKQNAEDAANPATGNAP
jgi:hypothetical protein